MTTGVYAADGSMNVTVVDGNSPTGVYAANGSINVILAPGGRPVGAYHPCGAWYITLVTSGVVGHYATDGSMNVAESPYTATGAVRITVVSGSLSSSSYLLLRNGTDFILLRNGTDKIILGH